jgi:phosphate transport system substrate-binding protein
VLKWAGVFVCLLLGACSQESAEGPTRGKLHVALEESVAPPIIRVIEQFNALYAPSANISYQVLPFASISADIDTVRLFFTSERVQQNKLSTEEFNLINLIVAYDAIVVVADENNPTEKISTDQLAGLLTGRTKSWKELAPNDGRRSSIQLFVSALAVPMPLYTRRFGLASIPTSAVRSSLEIIEGVAGNSSALGIVGIGWVDSLRPRVKMLSVARSKSDADTTFAPPKEEFEKPFSPHPANLFLNNYPMKRAVWMQGRTNGKDLAAGFSAFVASAEGQKILLQHGWLPATQKIKLKGQSPIE